MAIGDDNVKQAPGTALENEMKKVPKSLREQVDAELTEGEKVLWIGEPEASVKGRGFFGAMTGGARRKEPAYTLYAITNRRVMLWDKSESPTCYYSPHLFNLGLEADTRVKSGGNVLFKVVKLVTTTTTTNRQTGRSSTTTKVEMYYFGVMHVRNHRGVARLIYETLVEPLAD